MISVDVLQGEAKDTEDIHMHANSKPMFDQAGMDGWGSYVSSMTRVVSRRPWRDNPVSSA